LSHPVSRVRRGGDFDRLPRMPQINKQDYRDSENGRENERDHPRGVVLRISEVRRSYEGHGKQEGNTRQDRGGPEYEVPKTCFHRFLIFPDQFDRFRHRAFEWQPGGRRLGLFRLEAGNCLAAADV
jgi:hypothetical protein